MGNSDSTDAGPNPPAKFRTRVAPAPAEDPAATTPDAVIVSKADPPPAALANVAEATVEVAASAANSASTAYSAKAFSTMREWAAFNLETLAALTKAGDILVLGSHDLFQQARQWGQAAFDESLSGLRAIATAKTVKDGVELQANLIRTSLDHTLSDGKRLMLASLELAEKASAPLTARAAIAAEKLGNHAV
jgi:hypothetical protein